MTPKHSAPALAAVPEIHRLIASILRLGKQAGAGETEVHIDETAESLTRFANNAIHQNVAERGLTISIRTVIDGRTQTPSARPSKLHFPLRIASRRSPASCPCPAGSATNP